MPNPRYDLFGDAMKACAYQTYARMREDAPIVRQAGADGVLTWFVTRYADVDAVLRDERRFVRDPRLALTAEELAVLPRNPVLDLVTDNMLNKEGEAHRRLRRLVSSAFTPRMVEAMAPRIQAIADGLVADVRDEGRMDLIESYAFPLPLLVITELLGIPGEDRALFRTWSNAFVTPVADAENLDRFVACMEGFTTYVRALMNRRAAAPRGDLLAALMRAEDSGERLSESELFSMVILLIVAGHETTMNLLGNGVLALLGVPDRWREMASGDPSVVRAAVEELLRYDAPLDRALGRWAAEDTTLCGVPIRRGERVVALIGAANHDPGQFADPEALRFDRQTNPHCAFGRGAHYCLGAPLARLEGQIGLSTLVAAFPDLRLAVNRSALTWRPIPHMRSLRALPVEWTVTPGARETRAAASHPPR